MKLMSRPHYPLIVLACYVAVVRCGSPTVCMSIPAVTVDAGSKIAATIDNPQGKPCEATLVFTDPDFLPVHFGFRSLKCLGYQTAELTVPMEAPNGNASILWRCAGQDTPTCSYAYIDNGWSNPDTIDLDQMGKIECLIPTATVTTLVTLIGSGTTVIETKLSTQISTETGMSYIAVSPTPTASSSTISALACPPIVSSSAALSSTAVSSTSSTSTSSTSTVLPSAALSSAALTSTTPSSTTTSSTSSTSTTSSSAALSSTAPSSTSYSTPSATVTSAAMVSISTSSSIPKRERKVPALLSTLTLVVIIFVSTSYITSF